MRSKALAIDIDDQNFHLIPAPLLDLLQLFGAGFDRVPADRALRDANRGGHLWQYLVILSRRDAAEQRAEHLRVQPLVVPQRFIGRDLYFTLGPVTKARPPDLHLTVGQLNSSGL